MKYFNYLLVIFYLLPITSLHAQNVGVGTDAPVEFFSVGASSQFRVNASGNLVRINNVQYSFPAAQATSGSVLANDGSGNLSWTKVTTGNISATGTANNTTFLRGDGSWQTPVGGGSFPSLEIQATFDFTLPTSTTDILTNQTVTTAGIYLVAVSFQYVSPTGGNGLNVFVSDNSNVPLFGQFVADVGYLDNQATCSMSQVLTLPGNTVLKIRGVAHEAPGQYISNGRFTVTRLQ